MRRSVNRRRTVRSSKRSRSSATSVVGSRSATSS
jgi:hypothetical protein